MDRRCFLAAASVLAGHTLLTCRDLAAQATQAISGTSSTDSEADRAATVRYHAMNNLYFLEAAMKGQYPNAFVGETPYDMSITATRSASSKTQATGTES
jgi:beta-glucosidase